MPTPPAPGGQLPTSATPAAEYDHRGKFEPDDALDGPGVRPPAPGPRDEPRPGKPALSRALAQLATDYGFTDAEIQETDPDVLERAVLVTHRRFLAQARDNRVQELPAEAGRRAAPPPEPEPEPELQFEGEVDEVGEDGQTKKRKITEKDYDPNIIGFLKGQSKEIKELKSALTEFRQAAAAQRQQARDEAIDAAFDSLDPRVRKLLGTGPDVKKDAKSQQFRRRVAVLGIAGCDFNADSPAALREKITRGAAELFGLEAPAAGAPAAGGAYDEIPDEPEVAPPGPGRTAIPSSPARATPPKNPANGRFVSPDDEAEAAAVRDRRAAWDVAPTHRPTPRTARELPKGEEKAAKTADGILREMFPDSEYDVPIGLS